MMEHSKSKSLICAFVLILALVVAQAGMAATQFTTLEYPGAAETDVYSVSNNGAAVGFYLDSNYGLHGFRWFQGQFTSIDVPGAWYSFAYGGNNSGAIVGSYGDPNGLHGFLFAEGAFTTIDIPGARRTQAFGINDRGQIVGVYIGENDDWWHGYLYDHGDIQTIDVPNAVNTMPIGINDLGEISGSNEISNGPNSFTWVGFVKDSNGFKTIAPPSSVIAEAGQISNTGTVVGDYSDDAYSSIVHRFVMTDGNFLQLDFPDAVRTFVSGVNERGWTVGRFVDTNYRKHSFLTMP